MQQQLAGASRFVIKHLARRLVWRNMHIQQQHLMVANERKAIFQVNFTCPNGFNLRAHQLNACLVGFQNLVEVASLTVITNNLVASTVIAHTSYSNASRCGLRSKEQKQRLQGRWSYDRYHSGNAEVIAWKTLLLTLALLYAIKVFQRSLILITLARCSRFDRQQDKRLTFSASVGRRDRDLPKFSHSYYLAMLKLLTSFFRRHRWLYPLISVVITLTVWIGQPILAQALSLGDLIRIIPSGVQVIQLASLSNKQEVAIGKQMNDETITRQFRLYRGAELNQYVNQIGQRLAAQSGRTNIPYTYQIVEDKSVNAFATMGGFVYVTTGLMKLADNEAELASVIGHETGHIVRRHLVNQLKEEATLQGIATLANVNSNTIINLGTTLALSRPHSRNAEYEADQAGINMMGRSGYAQLAAPAFMSKLLNQASTPTFLSTHPATADRVARLKQSVNPAMANGTGLDNAAYKVRLRSLS